MSRREIRASWEDAALGNVEIPTDEAVRLVVERCKIPLVEMPAALPFFGNRGSILLPEGMVPALATAIQHFETSPDSHLLVTGHPGIDSAKSRKLATARADNVRAFLQGDSWPALCASTQLPEDWHHMLRWAATVHGIDCNPGFATAEVTPETTAALKKFRQDTGSLGVDTERFDAADWATVGELLSTSISQELGLSTGELAARVGLLQWMNPASMVCEPRWDSADAPMHDFNPASPQRVEVLIFPRAVPPQLARESHAGQSIYAEPNFQAVPLAYTPGPFAPPPVTPKGGGGGGGKPVGPVNPTPSGSLDVFYVDPVFAPSVESIDIGIAVDPAAPPASARIEVYSDAYGPDPIYTRELLPEELNSPTAVYIGWDGKANPTTGPLQDAYINPLYTPYYVQGVFDDGAGGETLTAALEFDVLYHSLTFQQGPWTAEYDETGEEPEHIAAWCKFWLNELGYHAGLIKDEVDADLEKAIVRYRRNHPTLWSPAYESYSDEIDTPLVKALANAEARRDWLVTTPTKLDSNVPMGDPVGDAFSDPTKETKVLVELLMHEQLESGDEFADEPRADYESERLTRPLIPIEVVPQLRSKSGTPVEAADAVGNVTVQFQIDDVLEPTSQHHNDPATHCFPERYLNAALAIEDGVTSGEDNCPVSAGGERGLPLWQSLSDQQNVYPPHNAVFSPTERKASVDAYTGNAFSNRRGRAGLILSPSYIGGDAYRIRASIDATSAADPTVFASRHASASLDASTGTFRVWRSSSISTIVEWAAAPTPPQPAAVLDEIAEEFHRAYIQFDVSNVERRTATSTLTPEDFFGAVEATTDWDPDALTFSDDALLIPASLPTTSLVPATLEFQKKMLTSLAEEFFDDMHAQLRKILHIRLRGSQILPGSSVLHTGRPSGSILVNMYGSMIYKDPNPPQHAPPFSPVPLSLGVSRSQPGAFSWINILDPDASYYVVSHEIAHCGWVLHHQNIGEEDEKTGASNNPDLHDASDENCLMSYSTWNSEALALRGWQEPGKYRPHLCGKCILNLRGWRNDTLPRNS